MLIDTISLELFNNTEHWKENGQLVLHDRFFMLRDFSFARKDFLQSSQPYRLQEGRVVIVKSGQAHYAFNLVDYRFEAGDLVVFLADTLIEKHSHSADFVVDACSFDYDSPWLPRLAGDFLHLHLDAATRPIVMQHIDLLWAMAREQPFPEDNVKVLFSSLLLYANRKVRKPPVNRYTTRAEELLRRFVTLVSQHAALQRNIPFYADKLCVAPHYLSTLVKQTSGRTVMQWINETAVKEAKVWLAYSDDTIAQIAHRMLFPCAASFTKFFKRETGLQPGEYRRQRR